MVSEILYISLQLVNCSGLGLECHGLDLGLVVYGLGLECHALDLGLVVMALSLECVALLTFLVPPSCVQTSQWTNRSWNYLQQVLC